MIWGYPYFRKPSICYYMLFWYHNDSTSWSKSHYVGQPPFDTWDHPVVENETCRRKQPEMSHTIFDSWVRCYLRLDIYKLEACVYCWHLLQHLLDFRAKQPLMQVPFAKKQLLKSERRKRLVSQGDATGSFITSGCLNLLLLSRQSALCDRHVISRHSSAAWPKWSKHLWWTEIQCPRSRYDDIFGGPARSGWSRGTHSPEAKLRNSKEFKNTPKISKAALLSGCKLHGCVLCGCCSMDVSGKPFGQVPYGTLVLATAMLVAPWTTSAPSWPHSGSVGDLTAVVSWHWSNNSVEGINVCRRVVCYWLNRQRLPKMRERYSTTVGAV